MEKQYDMLHDLRQRVLRGNHLKNVLRDLELQRQQLKAKVDAAARELEREQKDVDRLEGLSLAGIFFGLVGKKEEKLDAQRLEAHQARIKYESALLEQKALMREIQAKEAEQRALAGCEEAYEQALAAKSEAVKSSGSEQAKSILAMEKRIAELEELAQEFREAVWAGNAALNRAMRIKSSLDSAENYSDWDMLGGGLLADMAKHSELDDAQNQVVHL